MIRLRIDQGEQQVHRTFRGSTVVIGRSRKCDLTLPQQKGLSRFHARLTLRDGDCHVEDLGSRNRTLVNGRPVDTGKVYAGDQLRLGTVLIRVEAVREEESTEELDHACFVCGHLYPARIDPCPRCGTNEHPPGRPRVLGPLTFPGFRLVRRIGSGGMGIVFEAFDVEEGRPVALKVLRPHLAKSASYLSRFIEEIRLLTCLRHPSIVEVYGRGKEGDLHFITMELVEGKSARDALRDQQRGLPWREAARITWEAAKALNAAYQQAGVVHGDVKPGNFLVGPTGHVKLCDFGLAQVDLKRRPSRSRAVEEERRGTAAFAAPERFEEGGKPAVSSDIYSLGVSLFQMATGGLPFHGSTVQVLRNHHLNSSIPSVDRLRPGVNPGIQLLLERMMAKSPAARHRDYPALIADLSLLLQ